MLMTSRRHRQTIAAAAISFLTFASATGCDAPLGLDVQRGALGSATLVISQIYGGGGNSGAKYKNDFIEIFNRGATAVSVAGWSVQYASATGASWSVTALSGTIATRPLLSRGRGGRLRRHHGPSDSRGDRNDQHEPLVRQGGAGADNGRPQLRHRLSAEQTMWPTSSGTARRPTASKGVARPRR